jgi:hypothetical protein
MFPCRSQARFPSTLQSLLNGVTSFMPRENTTQGISFTPTLLTQAKTRAKEKGLSVSAYIQQLILSDLADDETRLDAATLARIKGLLQELVELRQTNGRGAEKKGS